MAECPVCFYVRLPIYQCPAGHIHCGACRDAGGTADLMTTCSVCRAKIPRGGLRNRALEELVEGLGLAEVGDAQHRPPGLWPPLPLPPPPQQQLQLQLHSQPPQPLQTPAAAPKAVYAAPKAVYAAPKAVYAAPKAPKRAAPVVAAARTNRKKKRKKEKEKEKDSLGTADPAPPMVDAPGFVDGQRDVRARRRDGHELPVGSTRPALWARVEVEYVSAIYCGTVVSLKQEGVCSVKFDADNKSEDIEVGKHRWRLLQQGLGRATAALVALGPAALALARPAQPALATQAIGAQQIWSPTLSSSTRVYRARQFIKESVTSDDPSGVAPSLWAVNNGCLLACARIVPHAITTDEQVGEHFRTQSIEQLTEYLRGTEFVADSETKAKSCAGYVRGYVNFVRMRAGDVVALQVKEGPLRPVFYFGQVVDDETSLLTFEQAEKKGFPIGRMKAVAWHCKRFMVRNVNWQRRAIARDLPCQTTFKNKSSRKPTGQKGCMWLLECVPFWFMDVTETGQGLAMVKAVDKLLLKGFAETTHILPPRNANVGGTEARSGPLAR